MAKTFVLHDESLNSHGYWMVTAGCDLSQFERNPIMLWNHNRAWGDTRDAKLPIGHWENIRIKGKQILADAVFDNDEFSQTIAAKVESGTLRMASVGATGIEQTEDARMIKPGQRYATITKWKLKEASIVNIGANDNALVALYDDTGNLLELSENGNCPLKLLKTNNMNNEFTGVKQLLNLSAEADEQTVISALQPLLNLSQEVQTLRTANKELQDKVEAIALAEKEANRAEAMQLLEAAFKDGRLNDDKEHGVRKLWEEKFEADHKGTKAMLAALPARQPVSKILESSSAGYTPGSYFANRQKEIETKNK